MNVLTPHPLFITRRFARIALPLLAAVVVCAPARCAPPPPTPSPAQSPMANVVIPSLLSPADAPAPALAAPRVPARTGFVQEDFPAVETAREGDSAGWLSWVAASLALSNLLAWTWVWKAAPTSRTLRSIFSPRLRRRRMVEPPAQESPWAADLRELHSLISRMKSVLNEGPPADSPDGSTRDLTAPRRMAFSPAKPPASAAQPDNGDLRQIYDELTEIRTMLGSSSPLSYEPRPQPLVLPEFNPEDAVAHEHRLTDDYNDAAKHPRGRDGFMAQFGLFRFGVRNRTERWQDAQLEPVFGATEQGDMIAVPLPERRAAVFPRFQTPLNRDRYQAGAMGDVFQCPNHQPELVYHQVTVERPAIFEAIGADEWRLVEQGELDLGPGQPA